MFVCLAGELDWLVKALHDIGKAEKRGKTHGIQQDRVCCGRGFTPGTVIRMESPIGESGLGAARCRQWMITAGNTMFLLCTAGFDVWDWHADDDDLCVSGTCYWL